MMSDELMIRNNIRELKPLACLLRELCLCYYILALPICGLLGARGKIKRDIRTRTYPAITVFDSIELVVVESKVSESSRGGLS